MHQRAVWVLLLFCLATIGAGCSGGNSEDTVPVDPALLGYWDYVTVDGDIFVDAGSDSLDMTISQTDLLLASSSMLPAGGTLFANEGTIYVEFMNARHDLYDYLVRDSVLFLEPFSNHRIDGQVEPDSSDNLVFKIRL